MLTKKAKNSKGKGKNGKMVQFGGRHVQNCFRYLRGKCEKGKGCGFTHSKDDSGRDAATGVVLGGDRLKVSLALVEASANAETDEWISDTGAALDVASAAVAGKREVSFAPPILSAGGVVNSVESVVIEMAEIGDTVKAAVLPNTPNALSAGEDVAHSKVLVLYGGRGRPSRRFRHPTGRRSSAPQTSISCRQFAGPKRH